jgi:glycosyltransferase involved in cell wall biosynthesis
LKVAIVCDSLVQPGGADRVLYDLLDLFPEAEIFTSVYKQNRYPHLENHNVNTTFIQRLPFSNFFYRHYTPLSPLGFESLRLGKKFDLVISVSAGCAKGVITAPNTFHLGIILTPPRYQWGGVVNCRGNTLRSVLHFFSSIFDHYLRIWDIEASKRPDKLVSISRFIKKRVHKVYKRESKLVYPGIDTEFWKPDKSVKKEDFYLIVSRLYDYKKVDVAIKACNKLNRKLYVIGEGPDRDYLENLAGETVEFKGYVSDKEVRRYMRSCKALLFPGLEDFGLAPLEAMSCGTPVIAFNGGGVAETVVDGVTGVLFSKQSEKSLVRSIQHFEKKSFTCDIIQKRAQKFSESKFKQEILKIIKNECQRD